MRSRKGRNATGTDMAAQRDHLDFAEVVDRLRRSHDAFDWPERRELVNAVAEQIEHRGVLEPALSLLWLLSEDEKWEVRKDVADCLMLLPDDEFPRFAARLLEDPNSFVQTATIRAMDRRRRGEQTAQRKQRGLDHIQEQYDRLERDYGSDAAELARQMAEQLYDLIVGATVHDMRNILAPLKSGISALRSSMRAGDFDPKQFEKGLEKLGHQSEMLERMIDDMRVYMQPTPTERRRERLADIIEDARVSVMDTFQATGRDASSVSIVIEVPENLTVEVSRHQVVRAISNVLKNAYESFATDPQTFTAGEVSVVGCGVDRERVEIIVSDNGMGLSPEELAEVRRFIPGNTSKKTHGTGFGLPIAKRKIEDHGGSLAIESEDGKGTTITITLRTEADGGGQ